MDSKLKTVPINPCSPHVAVCKWHFSILFWANHEKLKRFWLELMGPNVEKCRHSGLLHGVPWDSWTLCLTHEPELNNTWCLKSLVASGFRLPGFCRLWVRTDHLSTSILDQNSCWGSWKQVCATHRRQSVPFIWQQWQWWQRVSLKGPTSAALECGPQTKSSG